VGSWLAASHQLCTSTALLLLLLLIVPLQSLVFHMQDYRQP
jgi:hypothetical protein